MGDQYKELKGKGTEVRRPRHSARYTILCWHLDHLKLVRPGGDW